MARNRDDDSDTDWDSIYDETPAPDSSEHPNTASPSAKDREAAVQPSHNNDRNSPSESSRLPDRPRPAWMNDEETPLLEAGPPPPSYTDVTRNRPYSGFRPSPIGHGNTYDMNNAASPHAPVSPHGQEAQSMSERGLIGDDESTRKSYWKKDKRSYKYRCRKLARFLFFLLILAFITVLTRTTWHDTNHDESEHNGHDGTQPPVMFPNETLKFPQYCNGLEHYYVNHFYEFANPESFSFLELIEDVRHDVHEISGTVKVTAPAGKQDAAIIVGIAVATTEQYQIIQLNTKQTQHGLHLEAPTLKRTASGDFVSRACLVLYVTISVRPDIILSDFEIATRYLNLQVVDDLSGGEQQLQILNTTEFTTISGDVSVDHWVSRETRIDVTSGSVSGNFALRDVLAIKTQSGNINVDVRPKPVDKTAPAAAEFTAISTSGSIMVHFPTSGTEEDIPEREYKTRVAVTSGSITGEYIHGTSSTFHSKSGSLSVVILPYGGETGSSILHTESFQGSTDVEMLSPFQGDGHTLTQLRSIHKSISSAISLTYPQEWQGSLSADTLSGSITLSGRDVEVVRFHDGPVGKRMDAKKGSGQSRMNVSAKSGSITAVIGDRY